MKKILLPILIFLFAVAAISQTNPKPWPEWDKKEVEKMLNSSPWGQTQDNTDTSEMMYSPTNDSSTTGLSSTSASRDVQGAKNGALSIKYRVRLFSAKPIREAFARQVLFSNPNLKPAQLDGFLNGDYSEMIVVSISWEGADRRNTGVIDQAFAAATSETLKKKVYLERKDGKQIELSEYAKQTTDGTGAKFVFPRMLDGKAFVEATDGTLRFYADLGKGVIVNWRFKLAEMNYNGKFEL